MFIMDYFQILWAVQVNLRLIGNFGWYLAVESDLAQVAVKVNSYIDLPI